MEVSELTSRGIPEKIAHFLVSYFEGDAEKVYFVLNSLKKDIVVLKLKFSFSIYSGVSLLFINLKSKTIDLVKGYISPSNEITKINIESSWREVIRKISDEYKSLQIDADLSRKAEYVLTSDQKFVQTLIKMMSEDKTFLDIKRFLYTYVPMMFGDNNTVVRFSYENIDLFQFYRFLKESNIPIPDNLKFIENPESLTTFSISDIAIQPVLSPVDGEPITSLKPGDEIFVKIVDTDGISKLFIKGDGTIHSKITSIRELDNDRVLVSVEVGPGFLGNFVIKRDVKLKSIKSSTTSQQSVYLAKETPKTYAIEEDESLNEMTSQEIEEKIEKEKDVSLIFWIINLVIIGLGIATVIILLTLL